MPTFDPNVFDQGVFDSIFAIPLLYKVYLSRESRVVSLGESVNFTIHLMQNMTTFGRRFDIIPDTSVEVELSNPDKTVNTAFADMEHLTDGKYFYVHDVGISDQVGAYSARFKAVNGDKIMLTPKMTLFEVLANG